MKEREGWFFVPKGQAFEDPDSEMDGPFGTPVEPPICCGDTPPETDRFHPNWPNPYKDSGHKTPTRTCGKCGALWCLC